MDHVSPLNSYSSSCRQELVETFLSVIDAVLHTGLQHANPVSQRLEYRLIEPLAGTRSYGKICPNRSDLTTLDWIGYRPPQIHSGISPPGAPCFGSGFEFPG